MTEEDEEFNRIEREAAMRTAAVKATMTKREWVGLTDGEIEDIHCTPPRDRPRGKFPFARMIEAKLREKNT